LGSRKLCPRGMGNTMMRRNTPFHWCRVCIGLYLRAT
jgi:hypothetical protein